MAKGRKSFLQKVCELLRKCSFEILFYFIFIFKTTVFCTMLKSNNGVKLNLGTAIGLISYEDKIGRAHV